MGQRAAALMSRSPASNQLFDKPREIRRQDNYPSRKIATIAILSAVTPRLSTLFSSCHSRRSTPWERALFLVLAVLPVSGSGRRLVSDATYSTLLWSLPGVGLVLLRWVCRFRFICHGCSLLFTAYPKAYAS
jgi:hypothetical protein